MIIEQRISLLTERHEALTQSVELLLEETRVLRATAQQDAENIRALVRVAEIHERRLRDLKGGSRE